MFNDKGATRESFSLTWICFAFHGITAANCLNFSGTFLTLKYLLRIIQLWSGQDLQRCPVQPSTPNKTIGHSWLFLAGFWKPSWLDHLSVTCASAAPLSWWVCSSSTWVLLLFGIIINWLNIIPYADFSFSLCFVGRWVQSFKVPFSIVSTVALSGWHG